MKLTLPLALALAAAAPSLAAFSWIPTSKPASEVLPTTAMSGSLSTVGTVPATITGSAYTSLATALYSVQVKYENADRYSTVLRDMYSAAAKATNSAEVVPDLVLAGWSWPEVTAAPWFDKNVPKDDKKYVSEYLSAYQEVWNKALGDGKDSKGDDKKSTAGNTGARLAAVAAIAAGVAAGVAAVAAI
ncbi:Vacuolar protein sorting-associated protein 33A [Purpureocillium lavendulum]|uniref:Vacuolar protein sorting-associated protein 33A n=1 Tax=Purpureocillium lavendulum TaxID=1247861 RepID=A0AB34G4E0_9HYPO|nr:Vacuolar protein sorting-associated protein 33A [Purpureocillium lavendulum]